MESLFKEFYEKWLGTVNSAVEEAVADKEYWFKAKLTPKYSTDMTFSSVSGERNNVTADVVSMDSDLPLKSWGKITSYKGEIPKVGMQMYLGEKQLKEIKTLQALDKPEGELAARIFDKYKIVTVGAQEKVELMFAQSLSTGVTQIGADINTGRSIRVDFGIPKTNKFGVTTKWSEAGATPMDDIERITDHATQDGNSLRYMLLDKVTFNAFKKNQQVKEFYATYRDIVGNNLPTPNQEKLNEALAADYGLEIVIYDRTFKAEIGGEIKTINPWVAGAVSFWTTFDNVGTLWYSDLAEETSPVETKVYSKPETWLLSAMWREGNPLREFTEASGLVMPVLDNVDEIYLMDTTEATASEDDQTEGDAVYTYKGTDYTKASVVAGLNATEEVANSTVAQQDSTLAGKIDKLSEEGVATFEAELVENA